ncbi:MAG: GTP-binding protein [Anaerolineae bacterium]
MSILRLPGRLNDVRTLLRSLDWHTLEQDVAREASSRLAIVGPVNSGKSTLFNRLHGRKLSAVSAVPGTTTGVVEYPLGPFSLVDTPGFGEVWGVDRASIAAEAASQADLVLLLLDAVAGVRQTDVDVYDTVQRYGVPVIVALNKVDLIPKELPHVLENVEQLLGIRPIPISAKTGDGIVEKLLPAILSVEPAVSVAMAKALPDVRDHLIARMIRRTAWISGLISLEPIPGLDIPLLLVAQTRLVLRIAAVYGQSMTVSHARELLATMAGSLGSRYLGLQLAKLVPGLGWLVSATLSAVTTWGIGQAARHYFATGRQAKQLDLRTFYRRMRRLAPRYLFRRDAQETVPGEPMVAEPGLEESS